MSESGFHRPRRALAHDSDPDEPIAADDTGVSSESAARRGVDSQPVDPVDSTGEVAEPDDTTDSANDAADSGDTAVAADDTAGRGDTAAGTPGEPPQYENPFARPGSDSAAMVPEATPFVPAPVVPVLPVPDFEDAETTGSGRRMGAQADGPTPAPRRSAVSSATPPEVEAADTPTAPVAPPSWLQHHRKTLLTWGVGALVAAVLIVFGFYLAGQRTSTPPGGSPSPTSSTSISAVPPVTEDDLISVDDADKIVPGASWAVANTAQSREEAAKQKTACLSTDPSDVNPTDTFQRSMGTSEDNALAALHQIDVYANAGAARQVQLQREESLSKCDEVPSYIQSATTIAGLGDDVMQVTVSRQDDPVVFRTVLLVRTGRALTMLDVTRNGEAVEAEGAVESLQRSLSDLCTRADGMCPADTTVTPSAPPPVEPTGWLIESDLPRLRPGYGRWAATEPADITSSGMGCENMPLATEPGPTSRQQRTYSLTQDDQTPKIFGIDEMVFNFDDNPAALAFTTKLVNSLLSCKDRAATAQVADGAAINGTGADGVAVSARMITIDQATSDDSSARYQLAVAIGDTRVSYLLATVTGDYEFSEQQLKDLALRTAQRNSQAAGEG